MNAQAWIMLAGFGGTMLTVLVGIGIAWGRQSASIVAADQRFDRHEAEGERRHDENLQRFAEGRQQMDRIERKVDITNGSVAEAKRDIEVLRQRKSSG